VYTGMGADLLVSVQPGENGQMTGTAAIMQADGEMSSVFPVEVTFSADQRMMQLQADLDTIRQRAAQASVEIGPRGMQWRVAAISLDEPDKPAALFPPIDFENLPAAGGAPRANFSVSYTTSSGSLSVTFEDKSTPLDPQNPITGWLWDFGDGTTATDQNPQHTYAGGGEYTVTLTLTFADSGTDSMTVVVKLEGPPPPASPPTGACIATTNTASNLRDGPGTVYNVVHSVPAGTTLDVIGVDTVGDWYQVDIENFDSVWIAAFLLSPPQCPEGVTLPVTG
jgi:hypothetical protein